MAGGCVGEGSEVAGSEARGSLTDGSTAGVTTTPSDIRFNTRNPASTAATAAAAPSSTSTRLRRRTPWSGPLWAAVSTLATISSQRSGTSMLSNSSNSFIGPHHPGVLVLASLLDEAAHATHPTIRP